MQRTEEQIRKNIANNIAFYRKLNEDTQAGLAEKLNYSDKSVSKWERGEGTPDVFVLTQLANMYDITVDDLIREKPVAPRMRKHLSHTLIVLMSTALGWLVALLAFFSLHLADVPSAWLCFIYAIPVTGIVLTVFSCMWFSSLWQCLAVSVIVWGLALTVHITCAQFSDFSVGLIYAIAGVFQLLAVLWFLYLRNRARSKMEKI